MLRTRLITAVVALILMFSVFIYGNASFMRWFFGALVALSTFELVSMLLPAVYKRFGSDEGHSYPKWLFVGVILLACAIYAACAGFPLLGVNALVILLLLALLVGIFSAPSVDLSFGSASALLICAVYGSFPWIAIWELYKIAGDPRYVYFMCTIVWMGDTGAYFAGRALGKRKLAPRMSPNKTWEGSIGGIVASLLGGTVVKFIYGDAIVGWALIIPCCLFGGVFGQLGDLVESSFKRFSGVKDSGKIFPGHGGFLDRIDGLLFAAPVIWFILYQFGS